MQRDLRLHDHPAFALAEAEGHEILPVFIWDEIENTDWSSGFNRWSERKKQFLYECLQDLHYQLSLLQVPLLYREGNTLQILKRLVGLHGADEVWYVHTAGTEERERQSRVESSFTCRSFHAQSLLHPDDLPFSLPYLPGIFTEFRKRVERFSKFRPPLAAPTQLKAITTQEAAELPVLQQLSHELHSAFPFRGGEESALHRLQNWIWEGDHLRNYKETRNGLLGTEYSSKFSPWLAWGCLSPRYILQEIRKYESQRVANRSTYWLLFELLWRDFFLFTWQKEQQDFFKMPKWFDEEPPEAFYRWTKGETGQAFIDANMRELANTGFMSNRGRQNVASYLVHQLKLHWVHGARWFEHQLLDFEPCNNYGNWTYVAGVGHDPRENRVFNPSIQAERYDPDKRYINTWIEVPNP